MKYPDSKVTTMNIAPKNMLKTEKFDFFFSFFVFQLKCEFTVPQMICFYRQCIEIHAMWFATYIPSCYLGKIDYKSPF